MQHPTSLPSRVTASSLPSLPPHHQKIQTHTNITFSQLSLFSSQPMGYPVGVRFSKPGIWRHNRYFWGLWTLLFSSGCTGYMKWWALPESLFLGMSWLILIPFLLITGLLLILSLIMSSSFTLIPFLIQQMVTDEYSWFFKFWLSGKCLRFLSWVLLKGPFSLHGCLWHLEGKENEPSGALV